MSLYCIILRRHHLPRLLYSLTHPLLALCPSLTCADLGVGCGILSTATYLLGSAHNVGFDIDDAATQIARHNFAQLDCHVDLVHADIRAMRYRQADDELEETAMERVERRGVNQGSRPMRGKTRRERGRRQRSIAHGATITVPPSRKAVQRDVEGSEEESDDDDNNDEESEHTLQRQQTARPSLASPPSRSLCEPSFFPPCLLDTVVLNPPFGTRQSGVDVTFLHVALQLARTSVYSLHKSSTRPFFIRLCERWAVAGEVIAAMRFELKRSYAFHREAVREVEVDLWRFTFVDGVKPQRFCAPYARQNGHH